MSSSFNRTFLQRIRERIRDILNPSGSDRYFLTAPDENTSRDFLLLWSVINDLEYSEEQITLGNNPLLSCTCEIHTTVCIDKNNRKSLQNRVNGICEIIARMMRNSPTLNNYDDRHQKVEQCFVTGTETIEDTGIFLTKKITLEITVSPKRL